MSWATSKRILLLDRYECIALILWFGELTLGTSRRMATMNPATRISSRKTVGDWLALRPTIATANAREWRGIVSDYFLDRLRTRYMESIALLQTSSALAGEGFSIVTIQCSLIEFLESTAQGINYRSRYTPGKAGRHDYSDSGRIFTDFLTKRAPFLNTFDKVSARDFYLNVRCGLLHEATTKNDWTIRAGRAGKQVADTGKKIVFRNNFQAALLEYIEAYRSALETDQLLQTAFIRKYDALTS